VAWLIPGHGLRICAASGEVLGMSREDCFQFRVAGRPAGPVRTSWGAAADDAVADGYAYWMDHRCTALVWDNTQGGSIARIYRKALATAPGEVGEGRP
jgi:hypothetical protein